MLKSDPVQFGRELLDKRLPTVRPVGMVGEPKGSFTQISSNRRTIPVLRGQFPTEPLAQGKAFFCGEFEHSNPELLSESVYGLPELYKEDIRIANLVAVPGCYPTVSLISILPSLNLEQKIKSITIDAKSGMSGAGRSSVDNHLEKEMLNNFRLYGEKGHRHYPEIKQVVDSLSEEKIDLTFTVQLLPIMKGIYSTTYINFEGVLRSDMVKIYQDYYDPLKNITVVDKPPDLLDVVGTNDCKLFLQTTTTDNQILVTACIDNLLKGAAGQALECFNLMFNFEQNTGLN